MGKSKYSGRDYKRILTEVICNGLHHIAHINKEIHALNIKDPEKATPDEQNKLRALTMTMSLINDLIHPAHDIAYSFVKKSEHGMLDYVKRAQKVAFESKLVDKCFCSSCQSNVPDVKEEEKKDV